MFNILVCEFGLSPLDFNKITLGQLVALIGLEKKKVQLTPYQAKQYIKKYRELNAIC